MMEIKKEKEVLLKVASPFLMMSKLIVHAFTDKVFECWKAGEMTAVGTIQEVEVKKTPLYKLAKDYKRASTSN